MTSKNEKLLGFIVFAVCLIVGILCYTVVPAKAPESPVRVMFHALGGNVLFDHQTHSDAYNLDCDDCHHAYKKGQKEMPGHCGACHQKDNEYRQALGEKGFFNHKVHSEDYGLECSQCHHDYVAGKPGGLEPCGDCHLRDSGDESILNYMDAFHRQCIGCHEEMGLSPGKTECAGCHTPRKKIDAFHEQCMGCHADLGAGPGESDCKTCHGY
jgi:hypothetical protein